MCEIYWLCNPTSHTSYTIEGCMGLVGATPLSSSHHRSPSFFHIKMKKYWKFVILSVWCERAVDWSVVEVNWQALVISPPSLWGLVPIDEVWSLKWLLQASRRQRVMLARTIRSTNLQIFHMVFVFILMFVSVEFPGNCSCFGIFYRWVGSLCAKMI